MPTPRGRKLVWPATVLKPVGIRFESAWGVTVGIALQRLILCSTLVADLRFPCSAQRSMVDTP